MNREYVYNIITFVVVICLIIVASLTLSGQEPLVDDSTNVRSYDFKDSTLIDSTLTDSMKIEFLQMQIYQMDSILIKKSKNPE